MKRIIAGIIIVGAVSACKAKEPKPVSFYEGNEVERKAVVAKCTDNPGKYQGDADCINALNAASNIETRRIFEYKPSPVTVKGPGLYKIK